MALVWFVFMLLVIVCWHFWLQAESRRDGSMARLNKSALVVTVIGVVSLALCLWIQIASKGAA